MMKTIIELAIKAGWAEEACIQQKGYEAYHAKFLENLTQFAALVKTARDAELTVGVEMPEPVAWELFFYNGNSQGYTGNKGEAAEFGEEAAPLFTADQLRSTAAASVLHKDAEIALLWADREEPHKKIALYVSESNRLERERDALKAENERLREALERLAKLGNGDRYGNSIGNEIAQAALKGQP